MASEANNQRAIWLALGSKLCRLFRLNTGRGWISGLGPKGVKKLQDGSVLIQAARSIPLGFADVKGNPIVGACDLPGWTIITITPEMVGRKMPIFTSVEVKSDTGRPTPDQINWRDQIIAAGGIAIIARSAEDAQQQISAWQCQKALF